MHLKVPELNAVATRASTRTPAAHTAVENVRGWRIVSVSNSGLTDCCLIIPTFRRVSEIQRLLSALLELESLQVGTVPAEVVVVDGSPEDAVEEALQRFALQPLPFDLVYVRSRAGLTRQRNVGIDATHARYVFFLDDDAIPESEYFRAVKRVFDEDNSLTIGAVGGCVLNEWDRPISWRWRVRLALRMVPRAEPMKYLPCATSVPRGMQKFFTGSRPVDLLSGCAFSFRREVLAKHRFSGFFEGYSQGEDMEMSLRVGREWGVVCCGDAKIVHHEVRTARPSSYQKGRMEVRNRMHIWKLYSARQAGFLDRFRLASDLVFLIGLDLVAFFRRPWQAGPLRHLTGLLGGLMESLIATEVLDLDGQLVHYQVEWSSPEIPDYHRV